jgi:alkylation response protein AidB-like acyl-CoA dehydrogenase
MDMKVADSTPDDAAEAAYAAARDFVPRIREAAPRMRADRRLDDALVEDMEKAGLFSLLVPKRWGGAGLGPVEACKVTEIIGTADCSTGWVVGFYQLHNWILCRFPLEVQEQLFAGRSSVRAPAVFGPPSVAERVQGGYRITGRWPYGTGAWHASHVLVPAMVGEAMHWFIMPRGEVEYIDDWYMEGMSATGSISIAANDVFVADGWHCDINLLTSADRHPAAGAHDDWSFRLPFTALLMVSLSPCLGALDRAVELSREKLSLSRPFGIARLDRPASRVRWAEGYEQARLMRLLRDAATEEILESMRRGEVPTPEREARAQLHLVHFVHGVKNALRHLLDGMGSSTSRCDDPVFRMTHDVSALATHIHGPDYDVVMDRHARNLLGLGMEAGDPQTRLT